MAKKRNRKPTMFRDSVNDLTGQRFGRWQVRAPASRDVNKQCRWICHCDCGWTGVVFESALLGGWSKSCGCGRFKSPIIRVAVDPTMGAGIFSALFVSE